jgi:hypothetical protein
MGYLWRLKDTRISPGFARLFTNYSCFLCLWDSRATDQHYIQKVWPERGRLIPGMHNVIHEVLV